MGMSSPDSNATPENSSPKNAPKSVTLKCDKPRYDGGVEVNLERYFGRPLQPNRQLLEQRLRQHHAQAAMSQAPLPLAENKQATKPMTDTPCQTAPQSAAALTPPAEESNETEPVAQQNWFCKSLATCAEWGMWLGMLQLLMMSLLYARLMKQSSLTQPVASALKLDKNKAFYGFEGLLKGFAASHLWPFGKTAETALPVG